MRGRPWSWITGRPRLVDGLLVVITLVPGLVSVVLVHSLRVSVQVTTAPVQVTAASVGLVLLKSLPLWWRRRRPVEVLAIISAAVVLGEVFGLSATASDGAVIFGVYAVSVYGASATRLWVGGMAVVFTLASFATALAGITGHRESFLTLGAPSLVSWVVGDYIRSRRRFFTELVARHQAAREQATEEERLRIARELHDVVAHNVSVIAIQAGAARVSGNPNPDAMQLIETTARDTLAELNRLLGVLRKEDHRPALTPQPGLDQLDVLLTAARDAGVEPTLKVAGARRPVAAALDLTAYRIVQEAITNVLKHANASRVEVILDYKPDALDVTISDNGSGATAAVGASSGHGLIGMRERVEMFGGSLGTGSSSLGGFTVHATFPTK